MNPSSKTNPFVRESLLLVFFVIVFLIYSNTFRGPFIFDDWNNIRYNPNLRLTQLTLDNIKRASFEGVAPNRPVTNISFALNYYFHHHNIFGYRLVNILVHITAGIFLYFFTQVTLQIYPLTLLDRFQRLIPFFTALIWLVHPIQTQSVTYIVQRTNSLAAMFYILTFLLYVKARLARNRWIRWALFVGCLFSSILAFGSKEISATIPFFIVLYEWYFFQNLSLNWLRHHLPVFAGIFILFFILALTYLGFNPFDRILADYKWRDFTLAERVLTQFRVVIYYISLLLFPHPSRLNLDHDFQLSHSFFEPVSTLVSAFLILCFVGLAICMAKKERLISFCILWFFGNLLIESSVIGLEIIFEHRTYLPFMFVSLMAVMLAFRYIKPKWLTTVMLCFVVIICSLWTYERNKVWGDEIVFWKDCVEKSPKKARPHYNLGIALIKMGLVEEAIDHYLQALRIKPDFAKAHNNLGIALNKQDRMEEAVYHYLQALRIKSDFAQAHSNLGVVLDKQDRTEEAIDHYLQALQIKPDYAQAHNNLGAVLDKIGRTEEAIDHYLQVLRIMPDFEEAHYNLGIALNKQGRIKEAIYHYKQALRLNPDFIQAKNNLKKVLMNKQRNLN